MTRTPRLILLALLALVVAGAAVLIWRLDSQQPTGFRRGVNGDLWNNWGTIAQLQADPQALEVFPDWRRNVTPAMFQALADQGFDFIRLPTDPGPALAYGPGPDQDRLIEGMVDAAQMGLDAGLNVIVDLHPLPRGEEIGGIESILGDQFPAYVDLVARIAARLADLPSALELLNEPPFDCEAVYAGAPPQWPGMQARLHAAARAAAPDLPIILTGACWSQGNALTALDPGLIADTNVIWTFHSYTPYSYTHQGAIWINPPVKYLRDLPYPPSLMTPEIAARVIVEAEARMIATEGTADSDAIAKAVTEYAATPDSDVGAEITIVSQWADAHAIPRDRILMGEFGALHTVDDVAQPMEWYHAFLSDKRQAAEAAGMGWAVLSWSGGMGIAAPEDPDRRMSPETCRALGLPCGH
jgi:endoglucanase